MNEDRNSPRKPVPKADIPHRSTTFSTTEETSTENNQSRARKEALDDEDTNDSPNLPSPSKTQGVPPNDESTDDKKNSDRKEAVQSAARLLAVSRAAGSGDNSAQSTPTDLEQPGCKIDDPKILDDHQQFQFLELLSKGASPQAACQHLGISFEVLQRTLDRDPTFRARRDQVEQLLSQNVAAALYRAAMEGNVSAQTHWLRNNPPDHWRDDKNELPEKFQDLEKLSDDDLKRLANFVGEKIPQELAG